MALLKRLARHDLPAIPFILDGVACDGRAGDTIMTAALTLTDQLRRSDFSGAPRAGFCQMGACQDCWVVTRRWPAAARLHDGAGSRHGPSHAAGGPRS